MRAFPQTGGSTRYFSATAFKSDKVTLLSLLRWSAKSSSEIPERKNRMPLWPGATGASTPCSGIQMKGKSNFEVTANLEDPKHSLLDFSLAKVVS